MGRWGLSRARRASIGVFLCTAGMLLSARTMGSTVRTERIDPAPLQGVFDVILYGGRYLDDYETVAFLIPIRAGYTFEVYAPDFDYKAQKNLPAAEALSTADGFVRAHHAYSRTLISRILSSSGATVGYEVRPLYQRFVAAEGDVLDVVYFEQGNTITVKVSLKRWFRDQIERDRPRGIILRR